MRPLIFLIALKVHIAFDCRLKRRATATRSRVRRAGGGGEWGNGQNLPPPRQWGAFGQIPQPGAGKWLVTTSSYFYLSQLHKKLHWPYLTDLALLRKEQEARFFLYRRQHREGGCNPHYLF